MTGPQCWTDSPISPAVKAETIDAGKRIAGVGVQYIEQAMDDGWLQMARLSAAEKRFLQNIVTRSRLHDGEAESIALARSRKLMVILDDKEARLMAAASRVEVIGTAGVLLQAFQSESLALAEREDARTE